MKQRVVFLPIHAVPFHSMIASYRSDHLLRDDLRVAVAKLMNLRKASLKFDQGEQGVMQITADDGVCIPNARRSIESLLRPDARECALCGDTAARVG